MTSLSKPLSCKVLPNVLKHLEANKRINLSLYCPSIRSIEKHLPLKIDQLTIANSSLTINGIKYVLGETQNVENQEFDWLNRTTNYGGGARWCSSEEDVPVAGDIVIESLFDFSTEKDALPSLKFKDLAVARHTFLEKVDQALKGVGENPLRLFTPEFCEEQASLGQEHPAVRQFLPVGFDRNDWWRYLSPIPEIDLHDPVAMEFPDAQRAAIECLKVLLQETQVKAAIGYGICGGCGPPGVFTPLLQALYVLIRLALPPFKTTFHNELTVFTGVENERIYHQILPNGLSLREGFKRMTTRFLGQPLIHVGCLELRALGGIIGMPEGLKMKIHGLVSCRIPVFEAFKPTIDSSELKVLKCNVHSQFREMLDVANIASVPRVEFSHAYESLWDMVLPIIYIRDVVIKYCWMNELVPTVRRFKALNGDESIGRRCQMTIETIESFEKLANVLSDALQLKRNERAELNSLTVPMTDTMELVVCDGGRSKNKQIVKIEVVAKNYQVINDNQIV